MATALANVGRKVTAKRISIKDTVGQSRAFFATPPAFLIFLKGPRNQGGPKIWHLTFVCLLS